MLTDSPPRKAGAGFLESDLIRILDLPQDGGLLKCAKSIESAMKAGTSVDARRACAEFLALASGFYRVSTPGIRVLAARPLKVRESWATELFGDYNPETMLIRLWMRTAVREGDHLFRNIPEHPVPRILPSPRLSAFTISGFMAHSRFVSTGRALADRLAANESRCVIPVASGAAAICVRYTGTSG